MDILQRFVVKRFLFFFTIIFISLEFFFVTIDFVQHMHSLPNSINLKVLYIFYNSIFALEVVLTLSILFAFISTIASLIKKNELMSFYSFGIAPNRVLKPIFIVSFIIIIFIIIINTTPLSYGEDNKNKILEGTFFKEAKHNIFLRSGDDFVFFKRLYPLRKEARDIFIFKMSKNNDIIQITHSKRGFYQNNKWYFIQTTKTIKPTTISKASKMLVYKSDNSKGLDNFEPSIIKNIQKPTAKISIYDALYAMVFFSSKETNQNSLSANLYNQTIAYFYVFPLMMIIFLFANPSVRSCNISSFVMINIFLSIGVWGGYFLLQQLAIGDLINANLAIIAPIIILYLVYFYLKNARSRY